MPKRGSEDNVEFLAKRIKKLERQIKRSRRRKREPSVPPPSSSSSSSSSSSPSSSSSCSSPCSRSRRTSPDQYHPNDRDPNVRAIEHGRLDDSSDDVRPPSHAASPPPTEAPPSTAPPSRVTNSSATAPEPNKAAGPSSNGAPTFTGGQPAGHQETIEDDICPADLLEILGTDPMLTQEFGADINKEVATRLEFLATSGLDKEVRKELLERYLVPSNAKRVAAPQLNAEIKAAVTEPVIKRDKAIEIRQKQIAAAITSIGQILSAQINMKEKDNHLLKQLMDTARILCDIQHGESVARRNFTTYSLKKDVKEQLLNTKIDKYLFGVDLPETLKVAKAVSKSVIDLKDVPKKTKPLNSTNTTKNLNWRAGPPARKQQTGPPHRQQPAAPSSQQRARYSHKSSHRHKQTRRR